MTERVTWTDSLQEQFGTAPWWVVSAGLHVLVLMLLTLVTVTFPKAPEKMLTILVNPPPSALPKEPLPWPIKPPKAIEGGAVLEEAFIPREGDEIEEELASDEAGEDESSKGREDFLNDMESGPGVTLALGVGPGSPPGKEGTPWGRRRRREDYGKTPRGAVTIALVDAALEWLARHQEPDGRWDGEKYEGQKTDAGITGLAVLAFLGSGYTQKVGKYKTVVAKAVEWIISQQDAEGCIGRGFQRGLGYHHAICGLALAEDYGMTRIKRVGEAAQRAVEWSIEKHQCEYSGWRYSPKQAPDTSVTGWFVMQLKSAKVAGLRVDGSGFQGAIDYLDKVTTTPGTKDPYGGRVAYQEGRAPSPTMTSVGVLCRRLMGWDKGDALVRGGADYMLQNLPSWEKANFYYLYYATLATYMIGGETWETWNAAMQKTLIPNQRKGGDEDGSWDPVGRWCSAGGRVYSTAMGALCLEVYYRVMPLYK